MQSNSDEILPTKRRTLVSGYVKVLGVVGLLLVILLSVARWYAERLPKQVTSIESQVYPIAQSELWSKLRSVEQYPSWRPWVKSVQITSQDSEGAQTWTEVLEHGSGKFRILHRSIPDTLQIEYTPNRKTSRTTWTWILEPVPPDSTRVELQTTTVLAAPLYRIAVHMLRIKPEGTQSLLQALGSKPK